MNEYTHDNGVTIRRLPSGVFEAQVLCGQTYRSLDGCNWVREGGVRCMKDILDCRAAWFAWAGQDDGVGKCEVRFEYEGKTYAGAVPECREVPEPEPEPVTYTGDVSEWPAGIFAVSGDNDWLLVHFGHGRGFTVDRGRGVGPTVLTDGHMAAAYTRVGDFDPSVLFESGGAK